jgi:hypothetical protein
LLDAATLRLTVIVALACAGAMWLVLSWIYRVTGTWERVLSAQERAEGARAERMTLGQLGPFVTGRRDVPGGHQEFSGVLVGRTVRLTRRDHGVRSLAGLGFPDAIAAKLDGTVMAKLELQVKDGVLLEGSFSPQKVEFTHQPPRITRVFFLGPQPRRYRRLDALALPVEADVLEPLEQAPAGQPGVLRGDLG